MSIAMIKSLPSHTLIDKIPTAPAHLSKESREWFASVASEYVLSPSDIRILTLAAEQFDQAVAARKVLEAQGRFYSDPRGIMRAHPAVKQEKDAAFMAYKLVMSLRLDVPPPRGVGRPGAFSHSTPSPKRG